MKPNRTWFGAGAGWNLAGYFLSFDGGGVNNLVNNRGGETHGE